MNAFYQAIQDQTDLHLSKQVKAQEENDHRSQKWAKVIGEDTAGHYLVSVEGAGAVSAQSQSVSKMPVGAIVSYYNDGGTGWVNSL
jgi:hypothetical protein